MRTVSQSEAEANLPTLLAEVDREPIAIEKDGREVAILTAPQDFQARKKLLEEIDRFRDEAFAEAKRRAETRGENIEEVLQDLLRR